jgi:hypothetical protein
MASAPSLNVLLESDDPSPGNNILTPARAKEKSLTKPAPLRRGCGLGIVGSAVACFGAQQVLGNMVIRMLLVRGLSIDFWITNPPARLQALDLFAMQSGFFALGSHLAGLIHSHMLRSRVPEA